MCTDVVPDSIFDKKDTHEVNTWGGPPAGPLPQKRSSKTPIPTRVRRSRNIVAPPTHPWSGSPDGEKLQGSGSPTTSKSHLQRPKHKFPRDPAGKLTASNAKTTAKPQVDSRPTGSVHGEPQSQQPNDVTASTAELSGTPPDTPNLTAAVDTTVSSNQLDTVKTGNKRHTSMTNNQRDDHRSYPPTRCSLFPAMPPDIAKELQVFGEGC